MPKVMKLKGDMGHMIFCPACKMGHRFSNDRWSFNGDMEKPTFHPSMLVTWENTEVGKKHVCHSFVENGQIRFLGDCTHGLAGQTVDLPVYGEPST